MGIMKKPRKGKKAQRSADMSDPKFINFVLVSGGLRAVAGEQEAMNIIRSISEFAGIYETSAKDQGCAPPRKFGQFLDVMFDALPFHDDRAVRDAAMEVAEAMVPHLFPEPASTETH